jgi:hypothetical protein
MSFALSSCFFWSNPIDFPSKKWCPVGLTLIHHFECKGGNMVRRWVQASSQPKKKETSTKKPNLSI